MSLLLAVIFLGVIAQEKVNAKLKVIHYGQYGGQSIVCDANELIMVSSETLGYSPDGQTCEPSPPCQIPYTLARWYCRGKNTCTGLQVERRPLNAPLCISEFTNCLRIEYSCINSKSFCYSVFDKRALWRVSFK